VYGPGLRPFLLICVLALTGSSAFAQETSVQHHELQYSNEVRGLIRAEMAEIALAIQTISLSLATGDWASVESTSTAIRDSYVMKKSLTDAQKQELKRVLPDPFKQLDGDFHERADKLRMAAANRDAELAAFHFYRLLENCSSCHRTYAANRFPGLSDTKPEAHQH
jgi:cytochrome c556